MLAMGMELVVPVELESWWLQMNGVNSAWVLLWVPIGFVLVGNQNYLGQSWELDRLLPLLFVVAMDCVAMGATFGVLLVTLLWMRFLLVLVF